MTDETKLPLMSQDVLTERLGQLKKLFPEAFTEGNVDIPKLAQLLGDSAADAPERYGLSWAGKSDAVKAIQTLSPGTLLPVRDESVNFDTSENLIIEGDNLEVLKLLQGSYHERVKMIYIDPPYNTGGDFIYPDNYKEGLTDYLKFSGQVSSEGVRLTTNPETDGRFHSKWLTMIYPRLFLARNLLREDGVIFVSIDDHEVHNLRAVMNEIFGEENFLAELVYDKNRKNDAKFFSVGHEYIVCFAKNKLWLTQSGVIFRAEKEGIDEVRAVFEELSKTHDRDWEKVRDGLKAHYATWPKDDPRQPMARFTKVDEKGPYRDDGNPSWPGGGGPTYEVLHPTTRRPCKIPSRGWVFSTIERMNEKIEEGMIVFGPDETTIPSIRTNLFERTNQVMRSVTFSYAQTAAQEFAKIFDDRTIFENPKHVGDIRKLVEYVSEPDSIVLDFFAGSGTTAHAVLELNAHDAGNRKFILVQLPQPTNRQDFPTISAVTKERVRRVIQKLNNTDPDKLPMGRTPDRGFKAFALSSSNFKVWDATVAPKDAAGLTEQLRFMAHNVEQGRADESLLYELVLKSNLPLTSKIQSGVIGAHAFYDVADGTLAICLERKISAATLRGLMARKPKGVICLDIAFAGNDQLKTNTVLEMKSHGIEFHTA
jgi:adenine-specific DNA-methyltransferase